MSFLSHEAYQKKIYNEKIGKNHQPFFSTLPLFKYA